MYRHIVKGLSLSLSRHTSGVFVFPPAWFISALAPGQTHRRRAEEHRQRHLLHQQPAEVGNRQVATFNLTWPRFTNQTITSFFLWFNEAMVDTTDVWVINCDCFCLQLHPVQYPSHHLWHHHCHHLLCVLLQCLVWTHCFHLHGPLPQWVQFNFKLRSVLPD